MADRRVEHLIIGGGIAGATAAATLRQAGADGSILLVGRELDPPYHRPPVSKGYLRGVESREQTLVHPADWWTAHDVELLTRTSVTEIDQDARTAKLSTKETIEFATGLIATGAMVRRLTVDGTELDGIHYLRALANADAVRRDVADAEHVVLIGGSYIGCEVAASLTELGKRCTIVMQESLTLERHFGARAGGFFQGVLEGHGIEVVGPDEVERFEGDGRVQRVITKGGRTLPADAVICGVGAMPDVMLARKSGLEIGSLGGVLATAELETTMPGLYAAGDMCEYRSTIHGRVMRVEHEDVAAAQARTAAANMLGPDRRAHDEVPYFFSDLSDWASLEYVGPAPTWEKEIVRGSLEDGSFTVFYLADRHLLAALSVNRPGDLDQARRLIRAGSPLADENLLAEHDDLAEVT
ncbi:MAG: 3-phenylpropionate/trans-cinnamate dioxygenase ferredoxin reductase component [Solirubrobacteraceae bacterium]|nr:3-phenylpropionate/trans-cinnamate dioxygenase ferredoxin reductase component [Solirubrobacteraceae bacterium]